MKKHLKFKQSEIAKCAAVFGVPTDEFLKTVIRQYSNIEYCYKKRIDLVLNNKCGLIYIYQYLDGIYTYIKILKTVIYKEI